MNDQHTLLLRELQSLRGIVAKSASHEQEDQGGGGKKAKKAKEMQGEAKEMQGEAKEKQGEAKEKQGAKEKPGEPKKKKVSTPPDETQVDVGEEMETIEDDSEATPPPRPRLKEPPKRRSSRPRVPSNAAGMVWVINERNRLYGQRRNRIRTEKEIEEFRLRKAIRFYHSLMLLSPFGQG